MRLNRLDLIRYGRFEEASIRLERPAAGVPDVTLIYGPNEAGKSTAFMAYLELLYGFIAGTHPFSLRFVRGDMLAGGELDLPGRGTMVVRRNSKRDNSLLDAQERPIDEAILASALHGVTRESYEERFSLNEAGLREGGARIAGAKGQLGPLLHAGLSGLPGIAQSLDALEARADAFYRKRGRDTVLKTKAGRLKEIARTLRAEQLTPEREEKLRKVRERASKAFDGAQDALRQARLRQAASKAAAMWSDTGEEIARLTDALDAFPQGPTLGGDSLTKVAGLIAQIPVQTQRVKEAEADRERQSQIIADNPEDAAAQALSAEIARLDALMFDGAPLIGRASSAQADLARRREEQERLAAQLATTLDALGAPDTSMPAWPLGVEELETLADAIQECEARTARATTAREAVKAARAQLGDAPPEPQEMSALRHAFEAWQSVADTTAAEAAQAQALDRQAAAAAGLPKAWQDRIAAGLPALQTLDDLTRDWTQCASDLAVAHKDMEGTAAELADARALLTSQTDAPDSGDIARTEETRRQRDVMWSRHRAALTAKTAEDFEAALHADDRVRALYLTGAETRQRLQAARGDAARAEARHGAAEAKHKTLSLRHRQLEQTCKDQAAALGLAPETPPTAFAARHHALTQAANEAAEAANADRALAALLTRRAEARSALDAAAAPFGLTGQTLPQKVQHALALEGSTRAAWSKWREGQAAIEELEQAAASTLEAAAAAKARFDGLVLSLPLPDRALAAVRLAMPHLRSLQQSQREHANLSARIEAMERAIGALDAGAARLAEILGKDAAVPEMDAITLIDRAKDRVREAGRSDEKRAEAAERLGATTTRKTEAAEALAAAQGTLAACFEGQGGADLAPQTRIDQLAERDGIRARIESLTTDRTTARSGADAALFEDELGHMPDAARPAELEQALQDAQLARDAARDALRDAERLYEAAYEASERSDLVSEQAVLIEELRAGARQAAVDRLGVLAARGALGRLAAERRSAMVQDVEEAFVTMTKPAWSGVDVWSQSDGEKLIGRKPDGATVPVEQMSTGTMGQLYFALRLAGYRSFARDPGPLPMILDDIMETFDDTRALAALQLCAGIGASGQAILFTHHAHLIDLAREAIPGVAVATMPK